MEIKIMYITKYMVMDASTMLVVNRQAMWSE